MAAKIQLFFDSTKLSLLFLGIIYHLTAYGEDNSDNFTPLAKTTQAIQENYCPLSSSEPHRNLAEGIPILYRYFADGFSIVFLVLSLGVEGCVFFEKSPQFVEKCHFFFQTFAGIKKKLYLCGLICVYTRVSVHVCLDKLD